jgi:hypothetical protein
MPMTGISAALSQALSWLGMISRPVASRPQRLMGEA